MIPSNIIQLFRDRPQLILSRQIADDLSLELFGQPVIWLDHEGRLALIDYAKNRGQSVFADVLIALLPTELQAAASEAHADVIF